MKLKLVLANLGFLAVMLSASAQTIESIHGFTNSFNTPRNPQAGLVLGPDGNFYGSTQYGGSSGLGTIFKITTNGDFNIIANLVASLTGAVPYSVMTLGPDGNFYGTTTLVGPKGAGTVFRMTTNGVITVIASFSPAVWSGSALTNQDGDTPQSGVTFGPDGNLYGTTLRGGTNGGGTIFKITENGLFSTVFALSGTNGSEPQSALAVGPDGALYGTSYVGGTNSSGVVFRITTNGVFTKLIDFNGANGGNPKGVLVVGPDQNLYGTTVNGGSGGDGTVFKLTTNGVLTTIVPFDFRTPSTPMAGLTLGADGYLYGTLAGGNSGGGIFRTTTNGTLTILGAFSTTNGYEPGAGLTLGPDGKFYGTTPNGGPPIIGTGVIYRFSLPPHATNQLVGITLGADGIATLNVTSTLGSTNLLWAATNPSLPMLQWQIIATNIATNSNFQFRDADTSGKPMKFYRVSTP